MSKEIYISSTPHETRLAIVENDALAEIYYERENEYTLAGSIYNGRVTRVLPGMQSSFVDIGLERDAFLYITDFMEEAGETADFDSGDGSSRSERGGRREGRSRRDESSGDGDRSDRRERGRRDGRGRGERSTEQPSHAAPEDFEARADADDSAEPRDVDASADSIGEGSPGADETRRWRGRRGRRRGRGNDAAPAESSAPTEAASEPVSDSSELGHYDRSPELRNRSDRERDSRGDRDSRSGEREARSRDGRRGGRDRSERGDRNDRSDRGESSARSEPSGRTDRRDSVRDRFTPRAIRYAEPSESGSVDLQASSAEPFILPGESLSKYRRGSEPAAGSAAASASASTSASTPANLVTARPSTLVDNSSFEWDGGFVLPGESLSRRRPQESRPSRNDRSRTPAPARTIDPSEAVQPAVTSQHEPEPFELPAPAEPEAAEPVAEQLADTFDAASAVPEQHGEAHEPAEYEPQEEESASFRVDPVAPSEFRQSGPVPTEAEQPAPAAEPLFHASEEDAFVEGGAFTSIQASGEMLSAPVDPVVHEAEHSDAPIEHEAAVQSVTLHQAEVAASAPSPLHFAPGDGVLEEELLDEEETSVATLHASAHEQEFEEESVEGASDLGTLLRDMSIDQITQGEEPGELEEEEDDEFDFDEGEYEESDADPLAESAEGEEINGLSGSDVSEVEEEEFAEAGSFEETPAEEGAEGERAPRREGERRGRRDSGRRGGTRDRGTRDRRGMAGSRSGGRMSRYSAQTTNLPAISDLLKPGQEVLVQIAKEPIAKKGARITSHIALPGRFLVFMPTVSHIGVSRKIESDSERRRLKEVLLSEKGEASGGFIVRTAAAGASEDELRSDLRFLLNLWADIKQRSESSKSPALIYHDLNLVERILRDQVTDNFSAIWVDSESEYERVLRFLQRFQPSLIRRVKLYSKETPLFEQFGITEEINKALRSKVWLKSGGSIVINQTEALVAIDINTGKYVGKTARLEDTIVKTNLDAIPEIVRQIRLRDLGGIIIIDFIDMDERKNRQKVMLALEDELKNDRAPSKVLQFNDFGLVAITRKRVKQSLERTLSQTCGVCQGTGMVKSPVTVCNDIYIEMRKMQRHLDRGDVMLRVNPEVVKQLKAPGTKWLQEMEEMVGKTILIKSDPSLHPEQFDIH